MVRGTITVTFNGTSFRCTDHGGYESRNPSTIRMISDAWSAYPPNDPVHKTITIWTEDGFNPNTDYSYAIENESQVSRCIPHFLFESWPEIGVRRYAETFQQMLDAGSTPYRDPRVFWIGANTNPLRVSACQMSKSFPDKMDFRMMTWNRADPTRLFANTQTYVSLIDHCRYRVLIDLGAGGFSARLPLLFASGRPVIMCDRKHEAWFYWDKSLVPYVHYIPGGSTPLEVQKAVQWTFDNPDNAAEIGRRGQEYAKTHFSYDAILRRCASLLWNTQ